MKKFTFTLIVDGVDPEADDFEDRFFDAGCDDALISVQKGAILLEFDREARNVIHAVHSAYVDVVSAGARVVRIEPDPMVSVSDIASRLGLTRQSVSLMAQGKRGSDFPAPVARVQSESPLWNWLTVSRWMFKSGRLSDSSVVVEARVYQWANIAVACEIRDRMHRPRILYYGAV